MRSRSAYTLVELLLFVAITTVVVVAFVGILVITVRLQARQSSSGAVQQESAALLQQVQYYVQNASLVDIPMDTPTTTLVLRTSATSTDPITITLATSTGIVYLTKGSGAPQPLTSSHIVVSNLLFTRHANPPAHDTVNVTFTASSNTQNLQQFFTQAFRTTVTQVSAATFDSSVVPSSTNTYSLGAPGAIWNNINGVIYFNGSNVGIGTASPLAPLEVYGGDLFVYKPGGGVGLVLGDPSGGCWRVTVNASGTLGTASVSCSTP